MDGYTIRRARSYGAILLEEVARNPMRSTTWYFYRISNSGERMGAFYAAVRALKAYGYIGSERDGNKVRLFLTEKGAGLCNRLLSRDRKERVEAKATLGRLVVHFCRRRERVEGC